LSPSEVAGSPASRETVCRPALRVGRAVRIDPVDLADYLERGEYRVNERGRHDPGAGARARRKERRTDLLAVRRADAGPEAEGESAWAKGLLLPT